MNARGRIVLNGLCLALLGATGIVAASDRTVEVEGIQLGVATPVKPFDDMQTRIVGGAPSTANRSYQVYLGGCGGTILNDQWVLTAAHCGRPRSVRAGVRDLRTNEGQTFSVAEYISHPRYNNPKSIANDFALVRINGRFDPSYIRAQLPSPEIMQQIGMPNDLVVVSGWGALREGGSSPSVLHEVTIPLVSDAECRRGYGNRLDDASMICAGLAAGGKDSCQGDSGGPLAAEYQGRTYSIGVVSWGDGCARPDKYGVYSETVSAAAWIRGIIGGGNPPPTPPPPPPPTPPTTPPPQIRIEQNQNFWGKPQEER